MTRVDNAATKQDIRLHWHDALRGTVHLAHDAGAYFVRASPGAAVRVARGPSTHTQGLLRVARILFIGADFGRSCRIHET